MALNAAKLAGPRAPFSGKYATGLAALSAGPEPYPGLAALGQNLRVDRQAILAVAKGAAPPAISDKANVLAPTRRV
jgi:hypothetical protein